MENKTTYRSTRKKGAANDSTRIEYVIPLGNGWVVKNSQSSKFTVITDSKREAITIARNIAKNKGAELIVFKKDGKIQEKTSYAHEYE